jgi:IS4 transposase
VIDRGYHDAKLFNAIHAVGSSYVCRARDNLTPQVIEERPLSAEALEAAVVRDALVGISATSDEPSDHPLRLVVVQGTPHPKRTRRGTKQSEGRVLILTNLLDEPPELIALIYRYRWTIELFFRLLKQILGCRHLLSQRPEGIDIQIYCAVIAALLIHLETGKKPSKALVFVLGLYLAGWASEQEVLAVIHRPDNTGVKLRAKDELWKKLGY